MANAQCPSCRAPIDANQKVCEYCGTDLSNVIQEIKAKNPEFGAANEYINRAEDTIQALDALPLPGISDYVLIVVRWLTIIYTLGLASLIWRKQTSRFSNYNYWLQVNDLHSDIKKLETMRLEDPEMIGRLNAVKQRFTLHQINTAALRKKEKNIPIIMLVCFIIIMFIMISASHANDPTLKGE